MGENEFSGDRRAAAPEKVSDLRSRVGGPVRRPEGREAFLSKRSCNGVDGANLQGFVLARRSGFGRRPAAGSRQPICSARATMMPAGPRR